MQKNCIVCLVKSCHQNTDPTSVPALSTATLNPAAWCKDDDLTEKSFPTSEKWHSVDSEVEERGGGCGVLELSVVQAVTVFTFKREKIKDPKLKRRRGGLTVSPLFGRHPGICRVYWCWASSRDTLSPSLFPLVLLKLNGLCFKNTALSKTPLKLSFPFFLSLLLLCSSDKYYVSFWLKRCRGAFRESLVRSNPTERPKKGKMLVSISSEMWRRIVNWSQMLFQHASCAFPTVFLCPTDTV